MNPDGNKKILLLCQHFYPEMISTGMHMTELAEALTRLGWKITVCCAQPSLSLEEKNERVPGRLNHDGIDIRRVASFGSHGKSILHRLLFALSYLLSSAVFVLREAKNHDCVLVTTNPPFLGLVARLAAMFSGCPYVFIVYDVYPDITVRLGMLSARSPVTRLWEHVSRFILRGARTNVVIGRDMEEVIRGKIGLPNGRGRMTLIPNWSDERRVSPVPVPENDFLAENCLKGAFIVQYAGRMARTHNLEPLLEAAEMLKDRNVVFQFVGDGAKKRQLMKTAARKGLSNVQFLPYQPMPRLAEMLSAADLSVVCLESFYTGLSVPSKAYGVMAAGKPILGFLDGGSEIGRMIAENECGIVLPDPTGVQVAQIIADLMENPSRCGSMGENSRRAFLRGYTLSVAAAAYDRVIAEAVANSAP